MRPIVRAVTCFAAAVLALTVSANPAAAQGNTNVGEVSVLFWTPSPDLVLQSGALTSATGIADIDFVEEFGIENKTFPEIRLALGRSHKFRFSYVPVRYDAETIVERTITFRGQTFTIGAPARTEINWDLWRFGYQWDFVSRERGSVGVIAELKHNTLDAAIESPALAQTAATEQTAPVPTIGIAGRGYPHPWVAISAEFSGLKIDTEEFEAKFYDFDINGAVTFGNHFGVQGGYRSVTVDYFIDDDHGDLKLRGPYIGGIVKF
jgi:hypothetical protein